LGPIPNPQSPIPNPQFLYDKIVKLRKIVYIKNYSCILIKLKIN
jgi:hypothetical protein